MACVTLGEFTAEVREVWGAWLWNHTVLDGTVKVLDFGLAKALEPATAGPEGAGGPKGPPLRTLAEAHTITSPAVTMRGTILGTAAYMAPEQAKGWWTAAGPQDPP